MILSDRRDCATLICKSVNFSVPNPNKVYSSVDKCEISAFEVRGTITL